jgi:hypothetical protein
MGFDYSEYQKGFVRRKRWEKVGEIFIVVFLTVGFAYTAWLSWEVLCGSISVSDAFGKP